MKNRTLVYILILFVVVVFIFELQLYLNQINLDSNSKKQIKKTEDSIENNTVKSDTIELFKKEKNHNKVKRKRFYSKVQF